MMVRARRRVAGVAGAAVVSFLGLAAVPAASAASGSVVHITRTAAVNQSDNWSGYNIGAEYPGEPTGTTFSSMAGSWAVPTATQHTSGQAEDSATWVGIGGGCVTDNCTVTDSTLIQAGTEQDVATSGAASYYAWYELIPRTETRTSLKVSAGNEVTVKISQGLPGRWTIVIDNQTTGKSFTKKVTYTSTMDTAEWIEETPLELGLSAGLANLPNLGTVHIRDAQLNGAGPNFQTIDELQLADNGTVLATPSAPTPSATGFDDCTFATSCPTPSS